MDRKKDAKAIGMRQKRLLFGLIGGALVIVVVLVSFSHEDSPQPPAPLPQTSSKIDSVSQEIDPQAMRLSALEQGQDALQGRIEAVSSEVAEVKEEVAGQMKETRAMISEQGLMLQQSLQGLEERLQQEAAAKQSRAVADKAFKGWERTSKKEEHSVAFEIPAGTVLRAVVVSGVDCGVGVQKPMGANPVLLRPLDDGRLPRNIRVPLKGSVLVCNAQADLSTERVMIRGERLTLVEKDGSFAETEVSAYVSGEDGREGLRGVVVDRSGQIVMRAAFSSFLQGIGQTAEAIVTKQNAQPTTEGTALAIGTGGGTVAMGKLTDYYIKRAEQLQPAIQIAAGRIVDVIFTKSVKIGEKDLKKKIELQRRLKEKHE